MKANRLLLIITFTICIFLLILSFTGLGVVISVVCPEAKKSRIEESIADLREEINLSANRIAGNEARITVLNVKTDSLVTIRVRLGPEVESLRIKAAALLDRLEAIESDNRAALFSLAAIADEVKALVDSVDLVTEESEEFRSILSDYDNNREALKEEGSLQAELAAIGSGTSKIRFIKRNPTDNWYEGYSSEDDKVVLTKADYLVVKLRRKPGIFSKDADKEFPIRLNLFYYKHDRDETSGDTADKIKVGEGVVTFSIDDYQDIHPAKITIYKNTKLKSGQRYYLESSDSHRIGEISADIIG